jgi:hypothetical protein
MVSRSRFRKADPEFLEAVSVALQEYKRTQGPQCTNEVLAAALGVDESTIAKNITKRNPMMGEALIKACVDLGISFNYKGFTISAMSLSAIGRPPTPAPLQLEFIFDAAYSTEKNSWRVTQRNTDPLEFNLRIKIAS